MKLIIVFAALLIGASAFAAETPDLEIAEQADALSLALAENEMAPVGRAWRWDQIRVRTVLELGVDIPVIAKFSINPEVELFFVKK